LGRLRRVGAKPNHVEHTAAVADEAQVTMLQGLSDEDSAPG
jgi:hypothetical protein